MKILLIDADSTIPNIALMKLSYFYKKKGYDVDFIQLKIPYYPNRKKMTHNINTEKYDKIYCSVIFSGSRQYINAENAIFGGPGASLTEKLPDEIESCECDYSIYPDNDTSYGFISRGCIRNCNFCIVPQKEGYIKQVNSVDDIIRHKKVKFLDNNFLALPNHKDILQELIDKKIKCQFNQGLDIRLIDEENSILLSKLNYMGEYIFAFDNIKFKEVIFKKLSLLNWRKPYQFKFFIYINPNMPLSDTIKRIELIRNEKILPYIMRDISCWDSKYSNFFIDIAAWCNQPNLFKKLDFKLFLEKRYKNKNRILESNKLYDENI